jgi:hypothetical protein
VEELEAPVVQAAHLQDLRGKEGLRLAERISSCRNSGTPVLGFATVLHRSKGIHSRGRSGTVVRYFCSDAQH